MHKGSQRPHQNPLPPAEEHFQQSVMIHITYTVILYLKDQNIEEISQGNKRKLKKWFQKYKNTRIS